VTSGGDPAEEGAALWGRSEASPNVIVREHFAHLGVKRVDQLAIWVEFVKHFNSPESVVVLRDRRKHNGEPSEDRRDITNFFAWDGQKKPERDSRENSGGDKELALKAFEMGAAVAAVSAIELGQPLKIE